MLRKTALITGGNSGIGFAVAERLLEWDPSITLCLACRNQTKAEAARRELLLQHPSTKIDIISVDVSNIKSVYDAAAQIKEKYNHIDLVYLNAGIMPVSNVNWSHFWANVFSSNCLEMFRTGSGLLQQVDEITEDGFKKIFTTNLFGHFILIKEIQSLLGDPHGTSQIIWTSSSNAKHQAFSLNDVQHAKGNEPYSSSKYASDLVSVAINNQHNDKGIYSHTTCPGLVMSNITYGILPQWVWYLLLPVILLLRLFMGNMTHTARNGAEALVWLAKQKPEQLDPICKYHSRLSVTGRRYTEPSKLDVSLEDAIKLYTILDKMEEDTRVRYKSKDNSVP